MTVLLTDSTLETPTADPLHPAAEMMFDPAFETASLIESMGGAVR